jgi:hypothetical protein
VQGYLLQETNFPMPAYQKGTQFEAGLSRERKKKKGVKEHHFRPVSLDGVYCYFVFYLLESLFTVEAINIKCNILRRGYYPQGQGEVNLKTFPVKHLNPINITNFGKLKRIYGRIFVAGNYPISMAQRMKKLSNKLLKSYYDNIRIYIEVVKEPNNSYFGSGAGLI